MTDIPLCRASIPSIIIRTPMINFSDNAGIPSEAAQRKPSVPSLLKYRSEPKFSSLK